MDFKFIKLTLLKNQSDILELCRCEELKGNSRLTLLFILSSLLLLVVVVVVVVKIVVVVVVVVIM